MNVSIFNRPSLNDFMGLGNEIWSGVRKKIQLLLSEDTAELRDNDLYVSNLCVFNKK